MAAKVMRKWVEGRSAPCCTSSTPPQTGLQKNMGIYSKKGGFNLWREFPLNQECNLVVLRKGCN